MARKEWKMASVREYEPGVGVPIAAAVAADDLRKRILKLRWIGMEDEAERLSSLLTRSRAGNPVLMGPRDTD